MRRAVRADGAAFRLGQIMQKNTPPQNAGIFIVHTRHIQQFHRHGGVLPHIIAVPAPRLGAADAWLNLRHRPGKNPAIAAQHFARSGGGQQLIQLGINALGGNILDALPHVQRGALGGFLQSKIQLGGQPHRAQDAQGVLGKTFFRVAHAAHQAGVQVTAAAVQVDQSLAGGISHGVDGKIPPGKIRLHLRHKLHGIRVAAVMVLAIHTVGGDFVGGAAHDDGNGAVLFPR